MMISVFRLRSKEQADDDVSFLVDLGISREAIACEEVANGFWDVKVAQYWYNQFKADIDYYYS